jgi:hypothetical protein
MNEPQSQLRPFQFSLQKLFLLTIIIAIFLSVARTLGYGDAIVALVGVLLLIFVWHVPRRAHRLTVVVLTLFAGGMLWLNLRPTGWESPLTWGPPDDLDPLSKAMYSRGWPVSPWMIVRQINLSKSSGGGEALPVDGVFYVLTLVTVRLACESYFRQNFWFPWILCGVHILGLFWAALAIRLYIHSMMGSSCFPDLVPFAGAIFLIAGLAFMRIVSQTTTVHVT